MKNLAAGVAFADVLMRRGIYPGTPPTPFTPGYDVVGEVDATGQDVTEFAVGQRVGALIVRGGYSRYAIVPQKFLVPVPRSLDAAEAVCLITNSRHRLPDDPPHRQSLLRPAHFNSRRSRRCGHGSSSAWRAARAHNVRDGVGEPSTMRLYRPAAFRSITKRKIFRSACANFRQAAWTLFLMQLAERIGGAPIVWCGTEALLFATEFPQR